MPRVPIFKSTFTSRPMPTVHALLLHPIAFTCYTTINITATGRRRRPAPTSASTPQHATSTCLPGTSATTPITALPPSTANFTRHHQDHHRPDHQPCCCPPLKSLPACWRCQATPGLHVSGCSLRVQRHHQCCHTSAATHHHQTPPPAAHLSVVAPSPSAPPPPPRHHLPRRHAHTVHMNHESMPTHQCHPCLQIVIPRRSLNGHQE